METLYAVGFYPWKRRLLRSFRPAANIKFVRSPQFLPNQSGLEVATWGLDFPTEQFPKNTRLTRYEDGFIRSIGLGATFAPAYSWVADCRGIYFDARQPSDLEILLQGTDFPAQLAQRAQALHDKILQAGITKYNLAASPWIRPPSARKVILVPGQVESDSSIIFGSPLTRTNIGLLRAVRGTNFGDYIIYKPHPDVVSGRRRQGIGEHKAADWCNECVTTAGMNQLLSAVDEVHVMTSLTGFEALLRGKKVVTYGQPFYSGWGLTEDLCPQPRRRRKLHLTELIAGCLIKYPMYLSPVTGKRCEPEQMIEQLCQGPLPENLTLTEKVLRRISSHPLWAQFIAK